MKKTPICFVAYPALPVSIAESIEGSIEGINEDGEVVLRSWKDANTGGRLIIASICKEIENADLFIADITTLNHNVLFELGFAIALNKRIWLLLNNTNEELISEFRKFQLLTTVGYTPYSNSYVIQDAFFSESPHLDIENSLFSDVLESARSSHNHGGLLYLKSSLETEASVKLNRVVERVQIHKMVDDPQEVPVRSISWYVNSVVSSQAVLAHFLSNSHRGAKLHNAKNSFVCGLALGLGKDILMVAHDPYTSPIDYRDLLYSHSTAAQCESQASNWITNLETKYRIGISESRAYGESLRKCEELRSISIGDPVAENEADDLLGYFVRTGVYEQALRTRRSILVGRRGAGKTAFLYHMANEMRRDKRNHVCVIKPVSYELDGLLRMLNIEMPFSEKGFMIESFWKYLIYSELARTYCEVLKDRSPYSQRTEEEAELLDYCYANAELITPEFSIRLENALNNLHPVRSETSAGAKRLRISELLHKGIVGKLRLLLGASLRDKNSVAVIIDNLDKNWDSSKDLDLLSELLFSLLGVTRRIASDFAKEDQRKKPVNINLTLFIRSDIFHEVLKRARERDKISYSRMLWNDSSLLLNVIEERISHSTNLADPSKVWSKYFCENVNGEPVKEYIIRSTLPRPRDVIWLVREALLQASNRKHSVVSAEDLVDSQSRYSKYAIESLIAEGFTTTLELEELLYEFIGSKKIVNTRSISRILDECNIGSSRYDEIITLLCNLTFLGREVSKDRFEFQYDDDQWIKFEQMARRYEKATRRGYARYLINRPFRSYLEINE